MQQTHIIRKQRFKVITDNEQFAFDVHKIINDKLYDEIIPQIEFTLNENFNSSDVVMIDSLKINLGSLPVEHFQSNLSQLIASQLKEEIRNLLSFEVITSKNDSDKKPNITVSSPLNQKADALIYYFENGIFPWWFHADDKFNIKILTEDVLKNKPEIFTSYIIKTASYKGISRLTIQLTEQQLHILFLKISEQTKLHATIRKIFSSKIKMNAVFKLPEYKINTILLSGLVDSLKTNENNQEYLFIKIIVELIQTEIQSKEIITENFETLVKADIINEATFNAAILSLSINKENSLYDKKSRNEQTVKDIAEGIYIKNAGFIILHPFLEILFNEFQLLNIDKQFSNDACRQKALHVLNYLVNGTTETEEWNWLF